MINILQTATQANIGQSAAEISSNDLQIIINVLIVVAVIGLALLLWSLNSSLNLLRESGKKAPKGKWLNTNLHSLNADELNILITKLNKTHKNEEQA